MKRAEAEDVEFRGFCYRTGGEDILMSLKEADIGAIYLGSQETELAPLHHEP